MTNVTAIPGHVVPGQADPKIIALLEEVLKEARAGEISAVAIAIIRPDGCGDGKWSHRANYFSLIGALYRLLHRLADD